MRNPEKTGWFTGLDGILGGEHRLRIRSLLILTITRPSRGNSRRQVVPAARTYQQSDSDSTRETERMTEPLEPPSYDEIVAHLLKNGVSKSQLQESCGDFLEISNVVADWKLLARHFGLDKGDVEAIGLDETDEATRRLRMFETWKQRMGHKATYDALIKVFVKAGKAGFVEGIQKVLTRQGQQVTPSDHDQEGQHNMVVAVPLPLPLFSGTTTNLRHAYPEHRQRDTRTPENTGTMNFPTTAPVSSSTPGTHPVQDSQQDSSQAHIHNVRRPISVSPNFRKQSNSIFDDARRAGVTPDRSRQMRDLMTKYENLEAEYEIEKLHRARVQNLQSKLQEKIEVEREEADDKDRYYKEIIETMQTTRESEIEEFEKEMEDLKLKNREYAARLEGKRKQSDEFEQEFRQKYTELNDAIRSEKATSEKCSSLQRELESLKQKDIPTENEKMLCRKMYDTTLELDSVYESVLKDDKVHDKAFKDSVKRLQEETKQRKNCTWPP